MKALCLHDKNQIAVFLQRNPALYLYMIGDLDDFFWPYTQWYGLQVDGELCEVALVYAGTSLPVLLALSENPSRTGELLCGMLHLLPRRLYAHLSPGVLEALQDSYTAESHGEYLKMALVDQRRLAQNKSEQIVRLTSTDLEEIQAFYQAAYPNSWFDPRMLQTGHYFGVRQQGILASVAGVHVYSPSYGVAAIGNVATRPELRGQGLARVTLSKLIYSLLKQTPLIGLNVHAHNQSAIACYRSLGFESVAAYEEYMLELRKI